MESKIRILQVGMTSNMGGMETYVMSQYHNLNKERIQYDFLNVTGEKRIAFADEIEKLGGVIYDVPSRHINPIKHYFLISKLLYKQRGKYRGIVLNTCSLYYVFPLLVAMITGVKKRIIHSHNSGNEIKETPFRRVLSVINSIIMKIAATDYWACSKVAGEWMFGKQKFKIIHNAIETDKFLYNYEERKRKRQELNLADKFVVGSVARFSYQKNHAFLIDIFYEIQKHNKDAVLLMVGDTSQKNKILEDVKGKVRELKLNNVFFLGARTDIDGLYQAMDCLVMPSLFEGLSVVAVEAQAASLPIFASDAMSYETKLTEYFFQIPLEVKADVWAKKIIEYSSVKRKNMKSVIVQKGYDISNEIGEIEKFYQL